MANIVSIDEIRSSLGIGASDVAAIMHESPWESAYELWQRKTGRIPKPPQTDAMLRGLELEPKAFAAYVAYTGNVGMKCQVPAVHPELEYLRCIADGYDEANQWAVQIKCPTSRELIEQAAAGVVPDHYRYQILTEIEILGTLGSDFWVWDEENERGYLVVVSPAKEAWRRIVRPHIEMFWQSMCDDSYFSDDPVTVDERLWHFLITTRQECAFDMKDAECQKEEASAQLKRLMGRAKVVSAGGWKGVWTRNKPSYAVTVKCESKEALEKIQAALEPLLEADGVSEVTVKDSPERYSFTVKAEKNQVEGGNR